MDTSLESPRRAEPAPARFAATTRKEQALWLLDRLAPGSAANNLSLAFESTGRLQPTALQRTLLILAQRHETLRTVYTTNGSDLVKRVLAADAFAVPIEEIPATDRPASEALSAFVATPFPFDGGPMIRAGLLRTERGDAFCVVLHHLVFDTISAVTLLDEFAAVYDHVAEWQEVPTELRVPVAPLQEREPTAESVEYWRRQLDGFDPASLELAYGVSTVADSTLAGGQLTRVLPPAVTTAVRQLQKELHAPEAVILLAAYYALLAAHGAGPDLIVGSPVDTRPPDARGAVGYHINVLPLRVRVDPARSFRDLVRDARDAFLDGIAHADVPVDDLSGAVPRSGGSWRSMLFRHLFNYVPQVGLGEFTIDGASAAPLVVENGHSKFDLEFFVLPSAEELRLRAVHGTEFLDEQQVEAMVERYAQLLVAVAADADLPLGRTPVWSERDRELIDGANATAVEPEYETVLARIRARVVAGPGEVAVVDGDRQVTYGTLWAAAVSVVRLLEERGAGAGDTVAVLARRSPELVAAVLGSWLVGAAYLPIDPDLPAQRIEYQLSDSGARLTLVAPGIEGPALDPRTSVPLPSVDESAAPEAPAELPAPPDPSSAAYLMYTSGSTGLPKGTLVSHAALANLVEHFARELRAGSGDVALWLTTFGFDISGLELYVPLATGGRVVVAPDEAKSNGAVLADLIARHDPRIIQATPTTWRTVLDQAGGLLGGRLVLCGGEPAPAPLVRRLIATGCELHHVYGPTETTIWSTSATIGADFDGRVHVGAPIANTRVMVLDAAGWEVPPGVRGELCIAGAGVALGYHGRPELTAERFLEHPRYGRYYRTGDIARWTQDGTLELFGRGDRQIKLRGNRIELGEIESVLAAHPDVRSAAVVVLGDPAADAVLAAFVEVGADTERTELPQHLWEHCRSSMPRALIPQSFAVVDALPTNASGKVDYPELTRTAARRAPETADSGGAQPDDDDDLVVGLIALWRGLLEHDDVAADTNFFMSGGHSLLGALLVQRLEAELGITILLADLFAEPTPALLAARIRSGDEAAGRPSEARTG